jgi:glycosyltransferase involved in cell wall biosynthesis
MLAYPRRFYNRADCTTVPTGALKRSLFERGFPNPVVLSRGLDTRLSSPERRNDGLRRRWGVAPDALAVLHVGRLAWVKDLSALARLYRLMRAKCSGAKLVVVGDGPALNWLQAECPQAHFAGMRTGAGLATHYASGDLFCFPSMTETFGNVTAEAMASGPSLFAFDHAAAGMAIRSGENGGIAPFGETLDLLARTVEPIQDPTRLRDNGVCARTTSCTLKWGRIVEQIESVFQEVSGEGRRNRRDEPAAAGRRVSAGTGRLRLG